MSNGKGIDIEKIDSDIEEVMKKYGDIIDLPHPVSNEHKSMPIADRAAQFAPFAALTGLGQAMKETADENEKMMDRRAEEIVPIEDI